MKKILFLVACSTLFLSSSSFAAPTFQLGGDFVVPYKVDDPSGRLGMLAGGHVQLGMNESTTLDFTALFGIEDRGFADKPTYLIPGFSFYLPTVIVRPYISANVPILINNGNDVGVQGAGGVQIGVLGVALRYSVDVAYYFDQESVIVNWVHAGLAIGF